MVRAARVVAAILLGLLLLPSPAPARGEAPPKGAMPEVSVAELPAEARETLRLIEQGGPFPYAKDGAAFGNRERRLPARSHGYYREYTVTTPGARDRGARRIIAGRPGEYYFTDDHYASFRRIRD